LGLAYLANARKYGDPITVGKVMEAGKLGLLGLGAGVATAGIMESLRS
jgi:hypothetical protein